MNISLFTQQIKVFVADVSDDMKGTRDKLCAVLLRARIELVCAQPDADDESVEQLIRTTDCSVHILGNTDIYNEDGAGYNLPAGRQYRIARELRNEEFKMFVWNPTRKISNQNKYINNIRRDIGENTIFSSNTSPIVFVEELRSIMSIKSTVTHEIETKDVFFIYNDLDHNTASEILNMLEDILTVTKLPVSMSNDIDYTEYVKTQLPGCKIGVVYYDYAGDWAVSFARQVWKDNGGQSCKTPLLLIGNEEHAKQEDFKILRGIIAAETREISLVPLEIKVFYDNTTGKEEAPKTEE
ncbi:MAG: hypothetical protein K6F33_09805 [Bacteroidales bacterium]|nr:hypothetical protein [Bacteroidales bacterium]